MGVTSARVAPWPHDRPGQVDESPSHPNVGRMVIYRSGGTPQSQMPGVIIGQRASIVDLTIFSYHGPVIQEGCRLLDEPAANFAPDKENSCWLVTP